VDVFQNYFKAPLLLRFVCVEFCILALSSFTMFTHAMEVFGRILVCSFMFFILYSSAAISFNSCESDEKLLILSRKVDGRLSVFSTLTLVLASSRFSSNPSKELAVNTGLLSWYLLYFGYVFRYESLTFRACFGFSFYR